ncbi:MAG: hypothetical protein KBC84_10845 [Proteobacteria bacterium]|nr:hypothetical protein [Pseudomonadota bacterium]
MQYAALGASDTTGIGASPLTNGYVYKIRDGIETSGMSTNLMNYGIPDIEIQGIRDEELVLLDHGHKPDVVTLFVGVNDIIAGASASHFETELTAILNHLNKIDGAKVYIADLPDLTQIPRFKDKPDNDVTFARVQEFNNIIYQQAAAFNANVIYLSSDAADDNLVSDDGLHPNSKGYQRIADLFLQQILPRL